MRPGTMCPIVACILSSAGLVACGSTEGAAPDPAVYDTADPDQLDPFVTELVWSVDETVAQVEAALALGFPDPRIPIDAYVALLTGRDEVCPNAGVHLIAQEMPTGGCTSARGFHYYGNTTLSSDFPAEPGWDRRGVALGGDFEIRDPAGHILAGGGVMSFQIAAAADAKIWLGQAAGSWIHDSRDDTFGRGLSATLAFGGGAGAVPDPGLNLRGTLGVSGVYVEFVDVTWLDTCQGNPAGSVRIRDPSGMWSTLDYADRCDGCGTYTVDLTGVATEACLDLGDYKAAIAGIATW